MRNRRQPMNLAQRIKKIRGDLGMKQKDFGDAIGVAWTSVSGWEQGTKEPGKTRLYQIAEKFNVNLDWLIDGIGEPYKTAGEVDDETRLQIEHEYIKKLFCSLPDDMQRQLLKALKEMIASGEPRLHFTTENRIDVHGTVNGDVSINNKGDL